MSQPQPPIPNLSPQEILALEELTLNKNLVLKPADKGNAIVIMDRTEYILQGQRQLADDKYYVKIPKTNS